MRFSQTTLVCLGVICVALRLSTSAAFCPMSIPVSPMGCGSRATISAAAATTTTATSSSSLSSSLLLKSTNDDFNEAPSESRKESPLPANPPPPVPPKRLDPLMASLTRMDPETARGPTRNIPIFGEVPVDGSLVVLVPAALIGFLGFILSIVIAVQSSDLIVDSLSNVVDDIAQTAIENTNKVYDESVCRGLCSSQEQDLDGLRSFMEGLRK